MDCRFRDSVTIVQPTRGKTKVSHMVVKCVFLAAQYLNVKSSPKKHPSNDIHYANLQIYVMLWENGPEVTHSYSAIRMPQHMVMLMELYKPQSHHHPQ